MDGSMKKRYSYLYRFNVEELENLLRLAVDPQSDDENSEYVDAIMEVILFKEKETPTGRLSDVDQAWEEFQTEYHTEEGQGQSLYFNSEDETPSVVHLSQTSFEKQERHTTSVRFRQAIRVGLTAAVLVACLFGSMIVAQASGVDIFGAIARWTSEQFSFGSDFDNEAHYFPSNNGDSSALAEKTASSQEIPEEYKELQLELNQRGIPLHIPQIPKGYEVVDALLYIYPNTGNVDFSITYMQGTDCIGFDVVQTSGSLSGAVIYEKDNGTVELYEEDEVTYYLFTNNGNATMVWNEKNIEYSLTTNSASIGLKNLI